jgi:hypothetical protein
MSRSFFLCSVSEGEMWIRVRVRVFNSTFNNISVILWRSVLLADKTTNLPQVTDKLYHIILYRIYLV